MPDAVRDSVAEMLLDRVGDQHLGLRTRERDWTWDEVVARVRRARGIRDGAPRLMRQLKALSTSASFSTTCRTSCSGWAVPRSPGRRSWGSTRPAVPTEMAAEIRHRRLPVDRHRHPRCRASSAAWTSACRPDRILVVDDPAYHRRDLCTQARGKRGKPCTNRGRRGRGRALADAAAVHLRDDGCVQGGQVQPGQAGRDRLCGRGEVRPRARRRRVLLHAAVPRQRHHGAVGAGAVGRRDGVPRHQRSRRPDSCRTCDISARRSSPTWARRSAT